MFCFGPVRVAPISSIEQNASPGLAHLYQPTPTGRTHVQSTYTLPDEPTTMRAVRVRMWKQPTIRMETVTTSQATFVSPTCRRGLRHERVYPVMTNDQRNMSAVFHGIDTNATMAVETEARSHFTPKSQRPLVHCSCQRMRVVMAIAYHRFLRVWVYVRMHT